MLQAPKAPYAKREVHDTLTKMNVNCASMSASTDFKALVTTGLTTEQLNLRSCNVKVLSQGTLNGSIRFAVFWSDRNVNLQQGLAIVFGDYTRLLGFRRYPYSNDAERITHALSIIDACALIAETAAPTIFGPRIESRTNSQPQA